MLSLRVAPFLGNALRPYERVAKQESLPSTVQVHVTVKPLPLPATKATRTAGDASADTTAGTSKSTVNGTAVKTAV
jgi:hypothetical protein